MDIKFNTQIVDISVALNALKHYRAGEYKQAIEALLKILDNEPNNWDARLMLAASYYKTEQFAAAERAFEILKNTCPEEQIREKAQIGFEASTAKLRNSGPSGSMLRPDPASSFTSLTNPQALLGPQAVSAGAPNADYLRFLNDREAKE